MNQHTPGPWEAASAGDHDIDGIGIFARNAAGMRYYIGRAHFMGTADPAPAEANARLIAAAPDMLAMLQRLAHPAADESERDAALELIDSITGQPQRANFWGTYEL